MPVSIGDDYSYSPRPFDVASAAVALPTVSAPAPGVVGMSPPPAPRSAPSSVTQAGPIHAPAVAPAPVVASLAAPAVASDPAPASASAPTHASEPVPVPAHAPAATFDPALPPAPAPVVPLVSVAVSVPAPVLAASPAAVGAAFVPPRAAPAVAPSAAVAEPSYQPPLATSAGLSLAEVQSTHLWRLSESLLALLLVQVTAHASLVPVPADSLLDGPRDDCLDAADELALLLAPVLAAPARGGVAAVGQLDAAVRGLWRSLRAGSGAEAIAASTLVVREVWRTLSGLLAALEADRM
ncbi:unnamed protein product [Closterium sp. Naga37s-1]|nr:unnamed protein product [Closterium sp. Naga37s-1]